MKNINEFCLLISIVISICVQSIHCEEYSSDSEVIPDKTYPDITNSDKNHKSDNSWGYPEQWRRRSRRKRFSGWGGHSAYGGSGGHRGSRDRWQFYSDLINTTSIPINTTTSLSTLSPFNTTITTAASTLTASAPTSRVPTTALVYETFNNVSQNPYTKRPINLNKVQCGSPQLMRKPKVVGGKGSAFGAWPWQVSVRRVSYYDSNSTHKCGGALLNNQWVVTAAHCVDSLLKTQIQIRVGEYDFSTTSEPYPHIERAVKDKVVHPHYNSFTYENDIALVLLAKPINFRPHIAPICLPPDNVDLLEKIATVTGWGRLSEGGAHPTVLQEVELPIVSNVKCENMFQASGRTENISNVFICAGYDEGGRDSCNGDSGGPLQVQGADGSWFLAGIISWGINCGEPSQPGVCTRVSTFKQWILNIINS